MTKNLSRAKNRLLTGSLTLLILVLVASQADAGSYPSAMTTRYAGMIKPQNNLADYEGKVNSYYSTAYLGNYLSGSEGSGSHPGVDIQDGDCAYTSVRAVAQGEIVWVYKDWQSDNPGLDPCGNNSALGGWGNLVVIRHDAAPARGDYSGVSYTAYAHLWNVSADLAVGNKVLRCSVLGLQGSTGGSTGPHLHFQMDKEIAPNHPWWPTGLDVNSTAWQDQVRQNTFNPLLFVQVHQVRMSFDGIGAFAQYYDEQGNYAGSGYAPQIDYEWLLGHPAYPGIEDDDFTAT